MTSDLKLVYFDLRGRAEMMRLMLAAAGKPYEEERIQLGEEWEKRKPSTPFGALPYIVYKGRTIGQSTAIAQYLARELGYCGKTNEDGVRIGEVIGLCEDQAVNLVKSRWSKTEEEKAKFRKLVIEEDRLRFFGYFEQFLKENDSNGHIVGNSLTVADFYLYDMAENLLQLKKDALHEFPLLQKLRQNVEADPKVKAYLITRKETIC